MSKEKNPYAPPRADASNGADVRESTKLIRRRLLYSFATGIGVVLVHLFATAAHVYGRGHVLEGTPWFEISLIAGVFFVLSTVGAVLGSFISRDIFDSLGTRALMQAAGIAIVVLSLLINTDFGGSSLPDWISLLAVCLLPILICALSLVVARRFGSA